jgi:glycine/D-amino acid oxidase-like deaminating enzyme
MDLKSGYPFWTVHNGLPATFPPLEQNLACDVAVVGAGVTGALIAQACADAGLETVVVDRRDAAWGSTAASTALLQYEIDVELAALARRIGMESALAAYRACEKALATLTDIASALGNVGFSRASSLYLASRWHHRRRLHKEFVLRRDHGFEVEWLDSAALRQRYGLDAWAALRSVPAAQVDPYRLTYALLERLRAGGTRIFDRSEMQSWQAQRDGIVLRMQREQCIRCRHLVLAGGYETLALLGVRVAQTRSSYALVTEPLRNGLGPLAGTVAWETARPYLYLRSTEDGRLLIGGEDDRIDIASRRDARVGRKCATLLRKLRRVAPALDVELGFGWAGTFAETEDGLPFFGPHPRHDPRILFAMAYGGNGITYSAIGAEILRDTITGAVHQLGRLFSFARLGDR